MKISLMFRTAAVLLIAIITTAVAPAQLVPSLLNHQGLVTAGGTNFTGTGQFQFALVNGTGSTTYWSNSPVAIALPVNQGLYSVQLGDTNVTNMAALPATVFTNSDVRLRIAFAVSGSPQTLTPDQRIVAVGYALMAQTVADGAITSSKLAGSITNVTVVAGVGLSGGGVTSLGGTTTLALDLTRTNYWAAPQTINGSLTVTGNVVAAGSLIATGDVLAARLNVGSGNTVSGSWATVAGGYSNTATATGVTIGGGEMNIASNNFATVGGGYQNIAGGTNATVAGGTNNIATGLSSTVAGGAQNTASGLVSTVAGGAQNTASGPAATVGGGHLNIADGDTTTVAGGYQNHASNGAFIGGGGWGGSHPGPNTASGATSVIGGGNLNIASNEEATVGGGQNNTAGGLYSTVAGGYSNTAYGLASFVAGGSSNVAFNYSFAGGSKAIATNTGAFVWSSSEATGSFADNTVTIRAHGGVNVYTASGTAVGATLASGGGSWASLSDRNVKENFHPVDARAVLAKVLTVPVTEWNYKTQAASIHHIGPMAQDFAAAFAVGEDNRHISTTDADGVALAAIQGLYQELQETKSHNAALEKRMAELEKLIGQLSRPEGK